MLDIDYRWSPIVVDYRGTNGLSVDELKARAYKGYPGEDVRAGDRAPDAPALVDGAGEATALFDIFKPSYHTLLVFLPRTGLDDTAAAAIKDVLEATRRLVPADAFKVVVLSHKDSAGFNDIPGTKVYKDTECHAYKAYHVNGDALTLVAVRPDGYVGAFVNDIEGLGSYWTKVFATRA